MGMASDGREDGLVKLSMSALASPNGIRPYLSVQVDDFDVTDARPRRTRQYGTE